VKLRRELVAAVPLAVLLLAPIVVGVQVGRGVFATVLVVLLLVAYVWLRSTLVLLPLDH